MIRFSAWRRDVIRMSGVSTTVSYCSVAAAFVAPLTWWCPWVMTFVLLPLWYSQVNSDSMRALSQSFSSILLWSSSIREVICLVVSCLTAFKPSWSIKSWSIILGWSSLHQCQLLFLNLIQRWSPVSVQDQVSMWAAFGCEMCIRVSMPSNSATVSVVRSTQKGPSQGDSRALFLWCFQYTQ